LAALAWHGSEHAAAADDVPRSSRTALPGAQPPPAAARPPAWGGGAEGEQPREADGGERSADDDAGDGAEAALDDGAGKEEPEEQGKGEEEEEEEEEEEHDVGVDRAEDGRYIVSDESSDVEGEPVPDEADDRKDADATGFAAFVVRELPKLEARRPNLPNAVRQILLREQWETLAPSQRQVGRALPAPHHGAGIALLGSLEATALGWAPGPVQIFVALAARDAASPTRGRPRKGAGPLAGRIKVEPKTEPDAGSGSASTESARTKLLRKLLQEGKVWLGSGSQRVPQMCSPRHVLIERSAPALR